MAAKKVYLLTKAAQARRLAWYGAILVEPQVVAKELVADPGAEAAYADWLEEVGATAEAARVRGLLGWYGEDGKFYPKVVKRHEALFGHRTELQQDVIRDLINRADPLIQQYTSFRGYFSGTSPGYGIRYCMVVENYTPTIHTASPGQLKLGKLLTMLGHPVFYTGPLADARGGLVTS